MNLSPPKDVSPGTVHVTSMCGSLIVTEYTNAKSVKVKFLITGHELTTRSHLIRVGNIKDPYYPSVCGFGFVGEGNYKAYLSRTKSSKAYGVWNSMLNRCLTESGNERHPTYKNVSVCEEWFNFQNFAHWYYANYPDDGEVYELDKDILSGSDKKYSPETCIFITKAKNSAEANKSRQYSFAMRSPDGEIYSGLVQSEFCKEHGLSRGGLSRVLTGKRGSHRGWTLA